MPGASKQSRLCLSFVAELLNASMYDTTYFCHIALKCYAFIFINSPTAYCFIT